MLFELVLNFYVCNGAEWMAVDPLGSSLQRPQVSSLHSSHALRCLAAIFFVKGAVSNEACISGKAFGCHEPLEGDRSKSARGRLYGGQWLPGQLVCAASGGAFSAGSL